MEKKHCPFIEKIREEKKSSSTLQKRYREKNIHQTQSHLTLTMCFGTFLSYQKQYNSSHPKSCSLSPKSPCSIDPFELHVISPFPVIPIPNTWSSTKYIVKSCLKKMFLRRSGLLTHSDGQATGAAISSRKNIC